RHLLPHPRRLLLAAGADLQELAAPHGLPDRGSGIAVGCSREGQTATFFRKRSTSLRRSTAAFSTASEVASTVSADPRVSAAAPAPSPSAAGMSRVPLAALVTFCVISPVAAFCWRTEPATAAVW